MRDIDSTEGKKSELTENFYEMLEDLETIYEKIYLIMLRNKIISPIIEEGIIKLKTRKVY